MMADQDIRDVAQLGTGWLRIIVTGSRDWRDLKAIHDGIFDYLVTMEYQITGPWDVTIVQGGQVSEDKKTGEKWGADYFADQVALLVGFQRDPVPAEWERFGKKAGRLRNQVMVDKGAHVCLAFPLGRSPGTRDCMERAALAGIPVKNLGDKDPIDVRSLR
jgi:hypothetical protein